MTEYHDRKARSRKVAEAAPVQVFLVRADRDRLERLTNQLGTSKSDVLRQSLVALERQLLDPRTHPALRLIGLVDDDDGSVAESEIARNHDRYLAAQHEQSLGRAVDEAPRSKPASPRSRSRRGHGKP
jgi:hypothetical protein